MCTFQPENVTGCDSEGVKELIYSDFPLALLSSVLEIDVGMSPKQNLRNVFTCSGVGINDDMNKADVRLQY